MDSEVFASTTTFENDQKSKIFQNRPSLMKISGIGARGHLKLNGSG